MRILFFIALFLSTSISFAQQKTRILFILDASNSMNLDWDKQTRMAAAKEILMQSVEGLRGIPDLEIALRVYGHQSNVTNTYQDCNDTKLEVPLAQIQSTPSKQKYVVWQLKEQLQSLAH